MFVWNALKVAATIAVQAMFAHMKPFVKAQYSLAVAVEKIL